MDENFDGRISYNELKAHISGMGFKLSKGDHQDHLDSKGQLVKNFQWRDKGIEVIIRSLNTKLNKQSFEVFF